VTEAFFRWLVAPPHTTNPSISSLNRVGSHLSLFSLSRFFLFRHIIRVRSFLSREVPPCRCVLRANGSGFTRRIIGFGSGPRCGVLDRLCTPQHGHPAPGRHGTMGVTWQASVTRAARALAACSIHLCPSFLPLGWLNSNRPPPRNLLSKQKNVRSSGIFVNGSGFRDISESPAFHIL
jgi:hypothetical protein